MTQEFNLSEKINIGTMLNYYDEKDIKEFIKRLKGFIEKKHSEFQCASHTHEPILEEINKLAGDKLK